MILGGAGPRVEPVFTRLDTGPTSTTKPGTVVHVEPGLGPLVRTVDGCLWLTETVIEDAQADERGVVFEVGMKLGGGSRIVD